MSDSDSPVRSIGSVVAEETRNADREDDQVASLSQQLTDERERRSEERFLWAVLAIILFDAMIFPEMRTWTGPLVIGVLELIVLIVLASRCGVDPIMPLLTKVTDAWASKR